jgi:hypothetical protein
MMTQTKLDRLAILSSTKDYVSNLCDSDRALIQSSLDEITQLRHERDALMAVLDPLLVEIESFRVAKQQEIEGKISIAMREAWVYARECHPDAMRRALEAEIEPLSKAIHDANEVYDRIEADARRALESQPHAD